jgi:hypothetical protein
MSLIHVATISRKTLQVTGHTAQSRKPDGSGEMGEGSGKPKTRCRVQGTRHRVENQMEAGRWEKAAQVGP